MNDEEDRAFDMNVFEIPAWVYFMLYFANDR